MNAKQSCLIIRSSLANSRNQLKRDRLAPKLDRFADLTGIRDFRENLQEKKKKIHEELRKCIKIEVLKQAQHEKKTECE